MVTCTHTYSFTGSLLHSKSDTHLHTHTHARRHVCTMTRFLYFDCHDLVNIRINNRYKLMMCNIIYHLYRSLCFTQYLISQNSLSDAFDFVPEKRRQYSVKVLFNSSYILISNLNFEEKVKENNDLKHATTDS